MIVSEFVYLPWKHAAESAEQQAAQPPPSACAGTQGLSLAAVQAQADAGESRWLAQQIEGYFTDKVTLRQKRSPPHRSQSSL